MPIANMDADLQLLLLFKKGQVSLLNNGVRLYQAGGVPIDDLLRAATATRFGLARLHLVASEKLIKMRPPSFRSSISRSYYAMYQAARSVAFIHASGDDHDDHQKLHIGIPDEFPDHEKWKNALKDARARRNEADYDPYPVDETEFADVEKDQLASAKEFCAVVAVYLAGKGCPL